MVQNFIYSGDDVLAEYDSTFTPEVKYVMHPQRVDTPIIQKKNNIIPANAGIYHYYLDGLGSIIALADENANIKNTYKYFSFGDSKSKIETIENRYQYTAREYDRESDSYYYRSRIYIPQIGRFTRMDDIMNGVNWYIYVLNNAINAVDPFGYADACPLGVKELNIVKDLELQKQQESLKKYGTYVKVDPKTGQVIILATQEALNNAAKLARLEENRDLKLALATGSATLAVVTLGSSSVIQTLAQIGSTKIVVSVAAVQRGGQAAVDWIKTSVAPNVRIIKWKLFEIYSSFVADPVPLRKAITPVIKSPTQIERMIE